MFQISESKELINSLYNTDLFTDETKERVKEADILFLPEIGVIDGMEKVFRPDTKSFYKFIQKNASHDFKIEIFENVGEENVLNFHSLDVYLPVLYLRSDKLISYLLDLVHSYVEYKIAHGRNDEPIVNLILKVEKGEICNIYTYKGLMEGLKSTFIEHNIIAGTV